jgi:outer membrane protein insertion porin family
VDILGPIQNLDFVGGNYISTMNLSTTLPQVLPSFQNVDIALFADVANIWGVDYDSSIDKKKIRSTAGISFDMTTPIGPLNFSLSQHISKASTDLTETFRFNLGTTF